MKHFTILPFCSLRVPTGFMLQESRFLEDVKADSGGFGDMRQAVGACHGPMTGIQGHYPNNVIFKQGLAHIKKNKPTAFGTWSNLWSITTVSL